MDRNPAWLYKTLVVGVILLFVGVGIQPAFAVTPNSADSEDDCNLCPKVRKSHLDRLNSLKNRLKKNDNQLSVLSNHNPKVEEEFQGLSDKITTHEKLSSNSSICDFLYNYFLFIFLKCVLFNILDDFIYNIFFPFFSISLYLFYELYMAKFFFVLSILVNLSFLFDCPEWYWPPPYEEYNIGV